MSYRKAKRIVEKLLDGLSADNCTFGERFPDAYRYLLSFKADMIEDTKSVLEERNWKTGRGGRGKGRIMTPNEIETIHLALDIAARSLLLLAGIVGPWLVAGWWQLRRRV